MGTDDGGRQWPHLLPALRAPGGDAPAHCAGLHGGASEPRRGWVDSFWIFSPLLRHSVDFPPRPAELPAAAGLGELEVWRSCLRGRTGRYFPTPPPFLPPPPPITSWPSRSLSNRRPPPPGAAGPRWRPPDPARLGALHGQAFRLLPGGGSRVPGRPLGRGVRRPEEGRGAEDGPPPRRRTRPLGGSAPRVVLRAAPWPGV